MPSRCRLPASSLILFLGATLAGCGGPQLVAPESVGLSSPKLAEVRKLLDRAVADDVVAGAVALIARRGQIAFFEAAGERDREAEKPMRLDTIFRICSMTKPVTSVAAMILVDEGKLRLDDPVSKYIPEFKDTRVFAGDQRVSVDREVTIFHLLTHTSGLTYGMSGLHAKVADLYRQAGVTDGIVESDLTVADNARKLAAQPLCFQPGSGWAYGLSTDVLGRVIEVASEMTLDDFFRQRIFEPLGMKDTSFRLPSSRLGRLATVYRPAADDKLERQPDGPVQSGRTVYSSTYPYSGPGTYFSGGAGLVSTVHDYFRFCLMLQSGGALDGVRILKPETVVRMTRDQIAPLEPLFKSQGDGFGLGFGVVEESGKDAGLGSPGTISWGGFYYTYFWVDRQKDLIGIVMAQLQPWGKRTLWDDFRKAAYAACVD
jgi:CubicO group peptidase (beta-lactamase class C family)